MNEKRVKVGVGVILLREGRILLGQRKGAHGTGTWALPGGHLEVGESVAACAKREVKEETGITVHRIKQIAFINDRFEDTQKHYVTLLVLAQVWEGHAAVLEPEKCLCWQWFSWDNLPTPLFLPLMKIKQQGIDLTACESTDSVSAQILTHITS